MITTQCISCLHRYTVSDDLAERFIFCPQCGSSLRLVRPESATLPTNEAALWHVRRGDNEHGPHSFAKLQLAVERGFLDPDDSIRRTGDVQWIAAGNVADLFDRDLPVNFGEHPAATRDRCEIR